MILSFNNPDKKFKMKMIFIFELNKGYFNFVINKSKF